MLFPETDEALAEYDWAQPLIEQALISTDRRIQEDRPVAPAFLYGAAAARHALPRGTSRGGGCPIPPADRIATSISQQLQHASIPKPACRCAIWDLQQHLPKRRGKRAFQTLEHKRFRATYDFLLLRETAGEIEPGLATGGRQDGDEHEQARLIAKTAATRRTSDRPKRRPRRRRRHPQMPDNLTTAAMSGRTLPPISGWATTWIPRARHPRPGRTPAADAAGMPFLLYASSRWAPGSARLRQCRRGWKRDVTLALLDQLQALEQHHRRIRKRRWGPHAGSRPAVLCDTALANAALDPAPAMREQFRAGASGPRELLLDGDTATSLAVPHQDGTRRLVQSRVAPDLLPIHTPTSGSACGNTCRPGPPGPTSHETFHENRHLEPSQCLQACPRAVQLPDGLRCLVRPHADAAGIDVLLVGDSLGVVLGPCQHASRDARRHPLSHALRGARQATQPVDGRLALHEQRRRQPIAA